MEKEYSMEIDPKILELLGPSLYTNIYYVLAELVANAYDADAHNVYIIESDSSITVEDDGYGMSYKKGEVTKYLKVAHISRENEHDSITKLGRRKMGRKGVGKLAALSVSENVRVMTVSDNEKSGFVLSRFVGNDGKLKPIDEGDIVFHRITTHGTSIVMENPEYSLHATLKAIKRNLIKIFPLINKDFQIHIIRGNKEEVIKSIDNTVVDELGCVFTLGDDYKYLANSFKTPYKKHRQELCVTEGPAIIPIEMHDREGILKEYEIRIEGWIGAYKTTKGRKAELSDFPDNYISLYANKKMGEFNILPMVGKNEMGESYVVGQLHVDIFELTELPDMALSNRQGYKSGDLRYITVLDYVRKELLPKITSMRRQYGALKKNADLRKKSDLDKKNEKEFKKSFTDFKKKTAENAAERLTRIYDNLDQKDIEESISEAISDNSEGIGIKKIVDSNKKKILISHTGADVDLADLIFDMLIANGVPADDIIYTSCADERARIPYQSNIYDYLKTFFADSLSSQKLTVIFVTSEAMSRAWGAVTEVGASWIVGDTKVDQAIFAINGYRPGLPLDIGKQWQNTKRDENSQLSMRKLDADIFCQMIEGVCKSANYKPLSRDNNLEFLDKRVVIA